MTKVRVKLILANKYQFSNAIQITKWKDAHNNKSRNETKKGTFRMYNPQINYHVQNDVLKCFRHLFKEETVTKART